MYFPVGNIDTNDDDEAFNGAMNAMKADDYLTNQ